MDVGVSTAGAENPVEGLSALLVIRDDPTMRLAWANEALGNIGTIVAIDNVLSGTAKRANVVIAEGRAYASAGTYTQGDHRIQKLTPAVRPANYWVRATNTVTGCTTDVAVVVP